MSFHLQESKSYSKVLCGGHGLSAGLLCIERYCACSSRLLCKQCTDEHEHHLLISTKKAIPTVENLLKDKSQAMDALQTNLKMISKLRLAISNEMLELEKSIKQQLDHILTQQAMDQVVLQYLQKLEQAPESTFEYNYIALYLSTLSSKNGKEIHFDSTFKIHHEISDYLLQLMQNVQDKLQVLQGQIARKPIDKIQKLFQYKSINLLGPALELKQDFKCVASILVERPCFLIGVFFPRLSSLSDMEQQSLVFSVHRGTDLTQAIYVTETTIDPRKSELIEDAYRIPTQRVRLELYQEYTLAISAKDTPFFVNQFMKGVAANEYVQFLQKTSGNFKLPERVRGVLQNKGVIPALEIELEE